MELARWILDTRPTRFNARETRRKLGGGLREANATEVLAGPFLISACGVNILAHSDPAACLSCNRDGRAEK